MKFSIDECLGSGTDRLARGGNHGEFPHVVWARLGGRKAREPETIIIDGDWTFVAKSPVYFRGPKDRPRPKGRYAEVPLHAGPICLDGPGSMNLDLQKEIFEQAMDERSWMATW